MPVNQEKYQDERIRLNAKARIGVGVGDGWMPIIIALDEALEAIAPGYELFQIKEKFGALRYYTGDLPPEGDALVSAAETQAVQTCENCGSTEEVTRDGHGQYWLKTLCAACREDSPTQETP